MILSNLSKYKKIVIIKKGEIVRTMFESSTLYLSFDDNKVKRYSSKYFMIELYAA